jgi:DNA replication protein DnaC
VSSAADRNRVTRCGCRRRRDLGRLHEHANIPSRYRLCSLGEYGVSLVEDDATRRQWGFQFKSHPQLLEAVTRCKRYVEEFDPHGESGSRFRGAGLLFTGPPGVGKTHLAVATLRELIATHRVRGLFLDVTSFTHDLQSAIDPDAPFSRNDLLQPIERADVLVIDELFAQALRPWAADVLYDLINRRYARRLPTLFTTNHALDGAAARRDATVDDRAAADLESTARKPALRAWNGQSSTQAWLIPPMLVSRLWEMAQVIRLDAVRDYRVEIGSIHRRV